MRAVGYRMLVVCLAIAVAGCATTTVPTALPASTASGAPPVATPRPPEPSAVASAITEAGLRARLDALAAVSTGPGFRSVGTSGYAAAADLVAAELRAAGWRVIEDVFTAPAFADPGGSKVVVGGQTFGTGDVAPLIFSPAGDLSGPVVAVGWDETEPTSLGCAAADYGNLPRGAIVLVATGRCFRRAQVLAAQQAGAAAFVAGYPLVTQGEVRRASLVDPADMDIPALAASRPVGDALAAAASAGTTARLVSRATTSPAASRSIIGELAGSDPGHVVMLGAHLDSTVDGPGINDNGSGVAALLELARVMSGIRSRATIRLAFWSGEEPGLQGSSRYVRGLSAEDRDAIVIYLNADMVASPNGFTAVYDEPGPTPRSDAAADLLSAAVERAGGVPTTTDTGGASDHRPFGEAGIPVGGVYSGAGEILSAEQAASSGSTAGLPADPCYHRTCDDGSNLALGLARILTAALADVAVQMANDPTLVSD